MLDEDEVVIRHGIRCADVPRAVFDEMRRTGDPRDAVVVLDMACAAELISILRMRAYVDRMERRRKVPLVRWALDHAEESSRSPAESQFRLVWELDAAVAAAVVQPGGHTTWTVACSVPDLLDVEAGVVGEYDGAEHRTRSRHRLDVVGRTSSAGPRLEHVAVVGADLHTPTVVVERMEAARARSGRLPRLWSLEGGSWTTPRCSAWTTAWTCATWRAQAEGHAAD